MNILLDMARNAGFKLKEIGRRPASADDPREYYAFEMSL